MPALVDMPGRMRGSYTRAKIGDKGKTLSSATLGGRDEMRREESGSSGGHYKNEDVLITSLGREILCNSGEGAIGEKASGHGEK